MIDAPLVEITTPGAAAASAGAHGRWAYLGKSVSQRRRVEAARGTPRHPIGRGLQTIASDLRQPFLDFVADAGAGETDAVAWWSTTFSWKAWGASDLFLLVCYLQAARELVDEAVGAGQDLTLVVEDPWLAAAIAENVEGVRLRVRRSSLVGARAAALILGLARRIAWLGQTLSSWWRQRRLAAGPSDAAAPPTAAIYTYPMERCLRPEGGYADALLPGMDDVLRGAGHRVVFISLPERHGLERELAARQAYIRPLIQYCTFGAVTRSLCAGWRPRRRSWPALAGLRVDHLARREFWADASRAAWCRYRLLFECARGLMRSGAWEWIVFPFENQPWEKLLVLAARERGIRTAGVQHSTIGRNYLSYFPGRDEAARMPLPDAVLTSGAFAQQLLADAGVPVDRLRLAGSMRYRHLVENSQARRLGPAPLSDVLVGLPIDRPMAEHLLAALAAAFPDGGLADGIRFHVKSHPMTPLDPAAYGLMATTLSGSFDDALARCGTVIYLGSTTGAEAAAQGRAVLRYACALLVDVDMSEPFRDRIPVCGDDDIRSKLMALVSGGPTPASAGAPMSQLFAPVDWDGLAALFRRSPGGAGVPEPLRQERP